MNTWRMLYHSTRADFLERSRRYSFLVTLAVAIYCAYAYIPPAEAQFVTFNLGGYRGIYNSAWIGAMVAVLCSAILSIPGFFLVKSAVERDRETGVGQILATTPLNRYQYILSKFFSNFVFLTAMVGVMMAAAVAMQFIRGESMTFQAWVFFSPFLITTLPVMAMVSGLALLFEVTPFLRGGFGNIIYLFIYLGAVMASIMPSITGSGYRALNEPFGLTALAADMSQDVKEIFPEYHSGLVLGYTRIPGGARTFEWDGVQWSGSTLLQRLLWVAVSIGAAGAAASLFNRFDPSRESGKRRKKKAGHRQTIEGEEIQSEIDVPTGAQPTSAILSPVNRRRASGISLFVRIMVAEGKLMVKSSPWWWLLVALGLVVTGFLTGQQENGKTILLIGWLWPILVWSGMGCRERRNHTNEIVFSAEHSLSRQLPATWLAGFCLAIAMVSGILVHDVLANDWERVGALIAGAIFIPSLSLALGILSGSSKLFEVVYLILWYAGPANQIPALDFSGISPEAMAHGTPFYFLAASIVLLAISFAGLQRQIRVA